MTRPSPSSLLVVLALLGFACTPAAPSEGAEETKPGPPPATKATRAPPPPPASAELPAKQGTAPPEPAPALELGPPSGASEEMRAKQVLALLSDGQTAAQLPIVASDPGVAFDPRLVDTLQILAMPPKPVVRAGKPEVEGSLEPELVRRKARVYTGQIRECYAAEWAKNDELAGSVTLAFEIAATGKVGSPTIAESSLANEAVEACIVDRASKWMFPSAKGDTRVSYPLRFEQR